jgi:phosphomannomutase
MSLVLNPDIFKAYDVRGTYPDQIHEDAARAIGAAFVAYLNARRVAVGRDMRLSSPALAAAFIDGVTSQGADVVDYGMIPTDMLYYAVARDDHDGGVMITASHNPKQYNGMKMVRREAFPLSGEEGISNVRDMIAEGTIPPSVAARGSVTQKDVLAGYV